MKNKKSKAQNVDDIVNTVLALPAKNLETRIKNIEDEISTRRAILDEAMSCLGNQGHQLKDKIWRMRYVSFAGGAINVQVDLEKELARVQNRKTDECVSYFRDVSRLKENLQSAREELELEREKRKLVEG